MNLVERKRFPRPVRHETVAATWARRGYSCERFVDPPGQAWTGFVHESNELITVLAGALEVTVGSEILRLQPGDEAFVPGGTIHSVRNVHAGETQWLFGYD